MQQGSLDALRQEINAIDQSIIDALVARMTLAKKVGELKDKDQKSGNKTYLRPSREASVIRRALAGNQGHYPSLAIYDIWRRIMSSCVNHEQHLELLILGKPTDDIARAVTDYFGYFPTLFYESDLDQFFASLQQHPTRLGFLPWQSEQSWWRPLAATYSTLNVFTTLPYVAPENTPKGLGIASIDLEASEEDITLCVAPLDALSQTEIQQLSPTLLGKDSDSMLLALDGFLMDKAPQGLTPIGSYPKPIFV